MKINIPSVEVTVVYHCINRCAACNHFTILHDPYFVDIKTFKEDLDNINRLATVDKFSLIGGEALLHPQIVELLTLIQESGIAKKVNLTTNAQLIQNFDDDLWRAIDRIEMGIYAGKHTPQSIQYIIDKCDKFGIERFFGFVGPHKDEMEILAKKLNSEHKPGKEAVINPGFHKTFRKDICNPIEQKRRFDRCLYGHVCNTIYNGYMYRCPQAYIIPKLFMNMSKETDGLFLETATIESLDNFLKSTRPPLACRRCCSLEHYFPWYEQPDKELWFKEAMVDE